MTLYIKSGKSYSVMADEDFITTDTLPVGNYIINARPMTGELYLEKVDSFVRLPKYYGDTLKHTDRIINTFLSRESSTGVLLTGEKGSGKTLLAKNIAIESAEQHGIPTILINQPWKSESFKQLVQNIEQPCVLIFDEFEKVYNSEDQQAILTLLDGVYPTKKLFVLTCNDYTAINYHMRNRPGRIFYSLDFDGLGEDFVREYAMDNLKDSDKLEDLVRIFQQFRKFNIDMLKAIVEEMNRYDETAAEATELLNTIPDSTSNMYRVKAILDGKIMNVTERNQEMYLDPFEGFGVYVQSDNVEEIDDDFDDVFNNVHEDGCQLSSVKSRNSDNIRIEVDPSDLVKVNQSAGEFIYENKEAKFKVILSEKKYKEYDWRAI